MQPVGPAVSLDLGGASLNQAARLDLPVDANAQGQPLVLETDADGITHVHAPGPVAGTTSVRPLGVANSYAVLRAGKYTVWDVPTPSESGSSGLEVPFYWQAGYPWCVPTALAMALNYFEPLPGVSGRADAPSGRASNYALASTIQQSPTSGAGVKSILDRLGIPEERYNNLNWDAGLMNGIQFKTYVQLVTQGIAGLAPPRPLMFASDKKWHVKGLVGANAQRVYFNDGNDRWNGTLPSATWTDFFDAACDLKDPDDPSKGCSGKPNNGIYTFLFFADPRPETERRGSIELAPGDQNENPSRTLRFLDGFYKPLSVWRWDGGYPNGYFFSDEGGLGRIPYDATYFHAIPSSSKLFASFDLVNTTSAGLGYQLTTRLLLNGVEQSHDIETVSIPALSLKQVTPYNGFSSLNELAKGGINGPAEAMLDIVLEQSGVVQDEKQIKFKVIPPTSVPSVSITAPSANLPVYKGIAQQLSGSALEINPSTGQLSIPVPCEHMYWTSSVASDAMPSSCNGNITFTGNGQRTLTLTAIGYQGTVGSASVNINVTDPPANLPPMIDEMHIQDSLGNEIGESQVVATNKPLSLSVKAHDPENDHITYQWLACLKGWTTLQCIQNGNLTTSADGTASFNPLQPPQGYGTWTFSVTADDGHQQYAAIMSRTITVNPEIR
jgi:hypothetical protein